MDSSRINSIVNKYKIKLLVYFGSYGTEYYNKDSDIDIAYLSEKLLTSEEKWTLMEDLIHLHRKSEIDLVDLQTADPVLRYEIAASGRVLYEKEDDLFERYSSFYIKRYYELKPWLEEQKKEIGRYIKEVLNDGR